MHVCMCIFLMNIQQYFGGPKIDIIVYTFCFVVYIVFSLPFFLLLISTFLKYTHTHIYIYIYYSKGQPWL